MCKLTIWMISFIVSIKTDYFYVDIQDYREERYDTSNYDERQRGKF